MQSTSIIRGSKVIWQTTIIRNITVVFNTWRQSGVSSLEMLYQAFTAAAFICCLFVFCLYPISLRSGDGLGHWRIFHFFTFRNSWVAFPECFGSLSICAVKRHPITFAAFGWMWAESPRHFRIYPARSVSRHIIHKLQWTCSTDSHARAVTLPPLCLTDDVVWFGSCSFSSLHFSPPIIWIQVYLGFIYPKNLIPELGTLLNSNPAFMFMNVSSLPLNANRLSSILDLSRCCEGLFLHQRKDHTIIYFSHLPWSSASFDGGGLHISSSNQTAAKCQFNTWNQL